MNDTPCDEHHFPRFPISKIKIPLPAGVEDTPELRQRVARDLRRHAIKLIDADVLFQTGPDKTRTQWCDEIAAAIELEIAKAAPWPSQWKSADTIDDAKDGRQIIVRYHNRDGISRIGCVRWNEEFKRWHIGTNTKDNSISLLKGDPVEWCEIPGGHGGA